MRPSACSGDTLTLQRLLPCQGQSGCLHRTALRTLTLPTSEPKELRPWNFVVFVDSALPGSMLKPLCRTDLSLTSKNGCRDAGMHTRAERVLQDLVHAAVTTCRFSDAARHTLRLALDALAQVLRHF